MFVAKVVGIFSWDACVWVACVAEGVWSDMSQEIAANLWGFIQSLLPPIDDLSALILFRCAFPAWSRDARLELDDKTQYTVNASLTCVRSTVLVRISVPTAGQTVHIPASQPASQPANSPSGRIIPFTERTRGVKWMFVPVNRDLARDFHLYLRVLFAFMHPVHDRTDEKISLIEDNFA